MILRVNPRAACANFSPYSTMIQISQVLGIGHNQSSLGWIKIGSTLPRTAENICISKVIQTFTED